MLAPHLEGVLLLESADEDGVPEVGGDTQVLAAAHQGIGFAALDGGGEVLDVEVAVFALCLGDESV